MTAKTNCKETQNDEYSNITSSQKTKKRTHIGVRYLHCAGREWQPGCWQEVEMQTLHPLQLLTAYLPQHNLHTGGRERKMWEIRAEISEKKYRKLHFKMSSPTPVCWLVSRPSSRQQGHFAPQVVQVRPEDDSVALQKRQAPTGPHEAAESLVHTAVCWVYQLLFGLRERKNTTDIRLYKLSLVMFACFFPHYLMYLI